MIRTLPFVVIVALLVVGLSAGIAAADGDYVTIDTDHGLTDNETVSEYHSSGHVETDLDQIDGTVSIAESKTDVGMDASLLPSDQRNDYLRIEYNESFDREIRLLIPRDYRTPYKEEPVESFTSDHTARYQSVRGGDYLEVVLSVDEQSDIVLPLKADLSGGARVVEATDRYTEPVTGYSIFGGQEWEYLSDDDLQSESAFELDGDPDNIVIQYDGRPNETDEVWLNAPEGEDDDVGLYWYSTSDSDNGTAYLATTSSEPPAVRYKADPDPIDRPRGWANDAQEIPDRIIETIGSPGDILPLTVIP